MGTRHLLRRAVLARVGDERAGDVRWEWSACAKLRVAYKDARASASGSKAALPRSEKKQALFPMFRNMKPVADRIVRGRRRARLAKATVGAVALGVFGACTLLAC